MILIHKTITYISLIGMILLSGCQSEPSQKSKTPTEFKNHLAKYQQGVFQLPSGEKVLTAFAISSDQQIQGLSGIQPANFADNHAMLFHYKRSETKGFWMPDTYFDLDIYFLSSDFKVIYINRDTPHHPGRQEPPSIARTPPVYCRHVLEMKSSSPLAKKIKNGMKLKWVKYPDI